MRYDFVTSMCDLWSVLFNFLFTLTYNGHTNKGDLTSFYALRSKDKRNSRLNFSVIMKPLWYWIRQILIVQIEKMIKKEILINHCSEK